MGKRSRSYSESSSSDYDSDEGSRKKSRRDKGKSKERHKPSRSEQISVDDDFFAKSKEFRHWLANKRKPKVFAKMDNSDQRRYFKKFCKRWNKGKVDSGYYDGSIFGEPQSIAAAPNDNPSTSSSSTLPLGPSRPATLDDISMQREAELDHRAAQKDASRAEYKRGMREAKQEEQEGRATGRDRIQEKRAEKREGAKAMAASREQGDMEFGDDVLMGASSSSFADAIRKRDSSRQNQQKMRKQAEKQVVLGEKQVEYKKKENDTMAMFKAMAAARYGSGST